MSGIMKVLIFATARSGTNLFINLINQHPNVEILGEILSHTVQTNDPFKTIREYEIKASHSVFGFKLLTYQLKQRTDDPRSFIDNLFNDAYKIINIRRTNILNSAVSRLNAETKNQYHYFPKTGADKKMERMERISIDIGMLFKDLERMKRFHLMEDEVLKGKEFLSINYEKEMESSINHQEMINKVFRWLELEPVRVKARIEKSIPLKFQDYILNYDEMRTAVWNSEFRHFLPEE